MTGARQPIDRSNCRCWGAMQRSPRTRYDAATIAADFGIGAGAAASGGLPGTGAAAMASRLACAFPIVGID
jgi:hypothetical protein